MKLGFDRFMATAGRHEVLDHEREAHLGKLVVAGREAAEMLVASPDAPRVHRQRLGWVHAAGLRARDELISSNVRLAVHVAKHRARRGMRSLELEDLISEGVRGIITAVGKFDPARGYKFSTYATWWVRQSIDRAMANDDNLIRVPVHMHERIQALKKARYVLQQDDMPQDRKMLRVYTGWDAEELERVLAAESVLAPASLDRPLRDGETATLGDVIPDESVDLVSVVMDSMHSQELLDVVAGLPERERIILELRFGLLDDEPRTLDQVGEVFELTRERIRQLEAKALQALRHPSRGRALVDDPALLESHGGGDDS